MHRSCFCEQENGGLAVLNLRVGQLLRQHNRCNTYFIIITTAIPRQRAHFQFLTKAPGGLAEEQVQQLSEERGK